MVILRSLTLIVFLTVLFVDGECKSPSKLVGIRVNFFKNVETKLARVNRNGHKGDFFSADFSFKQDPCEPLKFSFKNETPNSTVVSWNFGNGEHALGEDSPITQYAAFGTYDVTLTVVEAGTTSTITKSVGVNVVLDDLIVTDDLNICTGGSIELNAVSALSYCWTPEIGLDHANIRSPLAKPNETTTYYLNSLVTGGNLIQNGDFSSGNTGFTSQYSYASRNTTEGEYFIGSGSKSWNASFLQNCAGHGGNGNMMMVNGTPANNIRVWTQTVSVAPNTNYAFSTWIQSLFHDNPAQLMFSINGVTIGNTITASLPVCNWTQFYTTWNSGINTTAIISIVNRNIIVWGNDFALDDISFAPVFVKRDSVTITVEKPSILARTDTTICAGKSVQMDTQGGFDSFFWTPAAGLSNPAIANPVAQPQSATQYIVTGTTHAGCTAKDTVDIQVNPAPVLSTIEDTVLCGPGSVLLQTAGDAVSYSWSPDNDLSDINIPSPVATPIVSTQYVITGTSAAGCSSTDTVYVVVAEPVSLTVSNDTTICEGEVVELAAQGNADQYEWTAGSSIPVADSPIFTVAPALSTVYKVVAGTNEGCTDSAWVGIGVNKTPVVSVTGDTTICPGTFVRLQANGGGSYAWSPSASLDRHNVSDPLASPVETTLYNVVVTDANSCVGENQVLVAVRPYPKFSASGDKVLCNGTSVQLSASGGDRYEWTPADGLDNSVSSSPIATPGISTQYSVYLTENICQIDTTILVNVVVNPVPQVEAFRSNDINCSDRTSQLEASGANSYVWTPALGLSDPNRSNPRVVIDATTLFTVEGTNEYGCTDTASVVVKVSTDGDPLFLLPNAFTPNNDGHNDCFGLGKWGHIQLEEFAVYNRWGEKIFSTNNSSICWDGNYKGLPQPGGTFVYVVKAKTFCGPIFRKGLVTLIR